MPARTSSVSVDDLEERLRAFVNSLFVETSKATGANGSLPRIVLDRRRERARARLVEALVWQEAPQISAKRKEKLRGLVERWAARDFEDGFAEAEELEVACAQERDRREAEAEGDSAKLFALQEQAHRRGIVAAHGSIEIRGLQMSARVHQDLEVAFVPLHIEDPSQAKEVKLKEGLALRHIPRLDVVEIVKRHDRVLMVGAPGSGKTTLVSYLAASAAAGKLREKVKWDEDPVPFVVPVRSLSNPRLDAEMIAATAGCNVAFVRAVLKQKRAMVLVDGLDEAGSERLKELLPSIRSFAKKYSGNKIVLTTRPASTPDDERTHIEGFEATRLLSLTRDEVYLFIDRWCLAAELSIQKDRQKAREDAELAAADLKNRVQTSRAVERLAETPLMASVLCIVHRFLGQRVPERRAALYEACTNVLLYEWDRAKFPEGSFIGRLDAEMKRVLLAGVARAMHEEGLAEIAREKVIRYFAERLPLLAGHSADEANAIVTEIQDRSGLLVERRPGFFAFSHLTFQEYLTAAEFVRKGDYDLLLAAYTNPWWHEVIALAAGLPGADGARIVGGLLARDEEGKVAFGTLVAAQCLETAIEIPVSLRSEVEARVGRLIPPRSDDDTDAVVEFGEIAGPVLLRALPHADANGRSRIAIALGRLNYEPACAAMIRLTSDPAHTTDIIRCHLNVGTINFGGGCAVGMFAMLALANFALASELGRKAFVDALPIANDEAIGLLASRGMWNIFTRNIPAKDVKFFRRVLERSRERLYKEITTKGSSRGKRSSKRVARSG